MYFAGCEDDCEGQTAQSFVVEVEGTGMASVRSSELSGVFMTVGRGTRSSDRGESNTYLT